MPEAPSHTYAPHEGAPGSPATNAVQVPGLVAHDSHPPWQGALQQKPSAQLPEMHCAFTTQASPSGSFWVHTPPGPVQKFPAAQSAPLSHSVGQLASTPLHTNGAHDGAPAAPAGTLLQVPGTSAQLSQAPLQLLSQQKPSLQKPRVHWRAREHEPPGGRFCSHTPWLHHASWVQPSSSWHCAGQPTDRPPHTYSPQLGEGVEPAVRGVQVPSRPSTLQASQALPQLLLQQ